MEVVIASLVTLVGVVLAGSAPVVLVRRLGFLSRAERTQGQVVARTVEHSGDGVSTPRLTVGYRVMDGRTFTLEQKVERDREIGESVEVLYDPADPERAYLKFGVGEIAAMAAIMVA